MMIHSLKGRLDMNTAVAITAPIRPQLLYDKQSQKSKKNKVDVYGKIAGKDGKLIFRNASLEEILKRLERHFNVEIQFNNCLLYTSRCV